MHDKLHEIFVWLTFLAIIILPGALILFCLRWLTDKYLGEKYLPYVTTAFCVIAFFVLHWLDIYFTA